MGQLAQGLCNDEKMRSNLESGDLCLQLSR